MAKKELRQAQLPASASSAADIEASTSSASDDKATNVILAVNHFCEILNRDYQPALPNEEADLEKTTTELINIANGTLNTQLIDFFLFAECFEHLGYSISTYEDFLGVKLVWRLKKRDTPLVALPEAEVINE